MKNKLKDYLALVEKRKTETEPLELEMPSGAIWLIKPVSVMQLSIAGKLPTSQFLKTTKNAKKLTEAEQSEIGVKALLLAKQVMLENLVFPKITLEKTDESIWIEEVDKYIDKDDGDFFFKWLMNGAQANKKK